MGCCPFCPEFPLFPCMLIRLTKSQEGSLGLLKDVALSFNSAEIEQEYSLLKKLCLVFFSLDSSNIAKFLEKAAFGIYFIKLLLE